MTPDFAGRSRRLRQRNADIARADYLGNRKRRGCPAARQRSRQHPHRAPRHTHHDGHDPEADEGGQEAGRERAHRVHAGAVGARCRGRGTRSPGLHGLPLECRPHGLRKAMGARLANNGATAHEIMAVLGLKTLAEAERYTREADRRRLGHSAIAKLEPKQPVDNKGSQTPEKSLGTRAKSKGK